MDNSNSSSNSGSNSASGYGTGSASGSGGGFLLDDEPWSSLWQSASTVFVIVTLVHFVGSVLWFLSRRDKYPINGHSTSLVLGCAASNMVVTIAILLVASGNNLSCAAYLTCVYNGILMCAVMYVARAWRLYINDRVQSSKLAFLMPNQIQKGSGSGSGARISSSGSSLSSVEKRNDKCPSPSNASSRDGSGGSIGGSGIDNDVGSGSGPGDLEVRIVVWLTERKLFAISLVVGLFTSAIEWIPYLSNGIYDGIAVGSVLTCPEVDFTRYVHTAFFATILLGVIYTLIKLRGVIDGYGIKTELARVSLWAIVIIINSSIPQHVLFLVVTFVTSNAVLFHTVTWKAWDSHRVRSTNMIKGSSRLSDVSSEPTSSRSTFPYTFESVMEDHDATEKFKQHLRTEWAIENLLFYQAAKQFSELCANGVLESAQDRTRVAIAIYETFIDEQGPSTVNLPSTVLKPLLARMRNRRASDLDLEPDLFAAAQCEILKLMKKDSFVRFSVYFSYDEVFLSDNGGGSGSGSGSGSSTFSSRLRNVMCCCLDCFSSSSTSDSSGGSGRGSGAGKGSGSRRRRTLHRSKSARASGRYTATGVYPAIAPQQTRSPSPMVEMDDYDDRYGTIETGDGGAMTVNDYLDMLTAENGSVV